MPTHVRFESDDEEMLVDHAFDCVPEVTDAAPCELQYAASARTDFNDQDACYVLDIACVANNSSDFVAACSNDLLKQYHVTQAGAITHALDFKGHTKSVTCVIALSDDPNAVASCAHDGTVRCWDLRTGAESQRCTAAHKELYSCSISGSTIAAGADGKVLFWDQRTGKQRGEFADTHAGEVAQVHFHPSQPKLLVTGSSDGLIAVHDTANGLDEDEGFQAALNIDTSVAHLGFYGDAASHLWCCSGTESLHLWECLAACNDNDATAGSGPLAEALQAREDLTAAAAASPAATEADVATLDYLVTALEPSHLLRKTDAQTPLWVAAGTREGGLGLFAVNPPTSVASGAQQGPLFRGPVAFARPGHHTETIRSVKVLPGTELFVTAGEDARICLWNTSAPGQPCTPSTARVVKSAPHGRSAHVRHRPY